MPPEARAKLTSVLEALHLAGYAPELIAEKTTDRA
jgi:hypothetical protein